MPLHETVLDFVLKADYPYVTMTIRARTITGEESEVLDNWQRSDSVVGFRRARMLRLSEAGWKSADIAQALGVHVETVRQTIKDFNEGGVPSIAPRPRSGGRQARLHTPTRSPARRKH